jgi:ribonuclease HIII
MKIIYGTKDTAYTMGIQVTSKVGEDITILIAELTDKGFKYVRSPVPLSFKNKNNTTTCHFYRDGAGMFGIKTLEELLKFQNDSYPILKSYDSTFKKTKCYTYGND